MTLPDEKDPYAAAGVNYAVMDPSKLRAQRAAESTSASLAARGLAEVGASRGESAYVVEFPDHYVSSVTEALGTKSLVADAVRAVTGRTHYDQIARDTVATILNDLATVGGHAVSLGAYWGVGRSEWFDDAERLADLTDGWAAACRDGRAAWGGGETQVLVGMIDPSAIVLGGAAVGCIRPKQRLLLGHRVEPGDAILIAAATGIHANGLTLARHVAAGLPRGYATPVPDDPGRRPFGEVLLDPAPLYGPLVEALQDGGVDLHYAVHVTGHGWRKLMRADLAVSYVVERVPEVNPIFRVLCQAAGMSEAEGYGTFNMGAGFAFYVAERDAERAVSLARAAGTELLRAGHVEPGPRRVVLAPVGVTFEGEALRIR